MKNKRVEPTNSTRAEYNDKNFRPGSSFISNKSNNSNYYWMKSISNKYNKRQKNNSMFIGDSDQLNVSNCTLIIKHYAL